MDYQSGVCNVTVVAEETSAEVSIAIFDDSIVEVNETFTAVLSVPAAEAALGVSVSATNETAYVEIQNDGKQSPLHNSIVFLYWRLVISSIIGVYIYTSR